LPGDRRRQWRHSDQDHLSVAHHYTDNDKIRQEGVVGNTAANGTFYVDVIDSTHYDLYSASGPTMAVASNGTWSNGDVKSVTYGGIQTSTLVTAKTLKPHPRIGVDPDGNLNKMAASVGNGLLTSIVDSGNTAEATYTRAHGLSVGHKICVYGASDNDLECSSTSRSKTSQPFLPRPKSNGLPPTSLMGLTTIPTLPSQHGLRGAIAIGRLSPALAQL
jgi:hypothetical protein